MGILLEKISGKKPLFKIRETGERRASPAVSLFSKNENENERSEDTRRGLPKLARHNSAGFSVGVK